MKHFVVIFSKPVILPGDNSEKIKTYGLLFNKTEKATPGRISLYIRNYILPVAELFKEGVEHFDDWSYRKDGKVFYVNDENWEKYVEKAEKRKISIELLDDDYVDITEEDLHEDFLLISKEKWNELKKCVSNQLDVQNEK